MGGLVEIFQIGHRLVFLGGHQMSVGADEIRFLAELNVMIVSAAIGLDPDRICIATIVPRHCPGPCIGMVDGRDLVVQEITISLVDENELLDDGLIVGVQGQPAGVESSRALVKPRVSTSSAP